jgi:hypothetical protein
LIQTKRYVFCYDETNNNMNSFHGTYTLLSDFGFISHPPQW